jgi:hypothetical protein
MNRKTSCIISLFLITSAAGCSTTEVDARQRISSLTGVDVPNESTMVYNYYPNVFLHGRLPQYTVFSFAEYPGAFLNKNNFSKARDESFEKDFSIEFEETMRAFSV